MPANLPPVATYDMPRTDDIIYITANASGANVNPGDYMIWSGHRAIPTAMAANLSNAAAVKASAIGVAVDANPLYDSQGNTKHNTALLIMRQGRFLASSYYNMSASADVILGQAVFPATTGSAVNAPTGLTGVGAQWGTADKRLVSGGTAGVAGGVGHIIGIRSWGTGSGKTQLEVMLDPVRPDYY